MKYSGRPRKVIAKHCLPSTPSFAYPPHHVRLILAHTRRLKWIIWYMEKNYGTYPATWESGRDTRREWRENQQKPNLCPHGTRCCDFHKKLCTILRVSRAGYNKDVPGKIRRGRFMEAQPLTSTALLSGKIVTTPGQKPRFITSKT